MQLHKVLILTICLLVASFADCAALNTTSAEHQALPASTHLSYSDAIILGLVEGVTEYLPVSSTGHLIITNALLGLDGKTPLMDHHGQPILIKKNGIQRAYTIGDAAYAYVIIIQAGAIVAVVSLYWRTIRTILLGVFGQNKSGQQLAINLIAAFIPAAVLGLLLDDVIEAALGDNTVAVASALIVGAGVMLAVERWRHHGRKNAILPEDGPGLSDLTFRQSLMIGCCQCFAMWPGTSRSMATIIGGYFVGLSPAHAAEFSFLLGLITLSAASAYKFVSDGPTMLAALDTGPVLVGCIVAFVSATLSVKWLIRYLSRHGLGLFAWYRIALAISIFAFIR